MFHVNVSSKICTVLPKCVFYSFGEKYGFSLLPNFCQNGHQSGTFRTRRCFCYCILQLWIKYIELLSFWTSHNWMSHNRTICQKYCQPLLNDISFLIFVRNNLQYFQTTLTNLKVLMQKSFHVFGLSNILYDMKQQLDVSRKYSIIDGLFDNSQVYVSKSTAIPFTNLFSIKEK